MSSPGNVPVPRSAQPSRSSRLGIWAILAGGGIVTLLLLGTCGRSAYHWYRLADGAVGRFHGQLDHGEYEDAYSEATDDFRNASSRQEQIAFFQTVHDKLGDSGKGSIRSFHVTVNTKGTFVSVVYHTEFAAGAADEYFVWRMDQEQPRLWGYHVDSPNLR